MRQKRGSGDKCLLCAREREATMALNAFLVLSEMETCACSILLDFVWGEIILFTNMVTISLSGPNVSSFLSLIFCDETVTNLEVKFPTWAEN